MRRDPAHGRTRHRFGPPERAAADIERQGAAMPQAARGGDATAPAEQGMPDLAAELAPGLPSLSGLPLSERDEERRR
ncbi:hypothetical protein ABZS83_18595 [Streptomyces sp. NPDC005426]|uniref:hypothetical protein n=1 Tax=Streptomyces sp. NPDC005426 TaxID=3155344 RepID=UPI0033B393F8